jgi:Fe-S cluster assembly protein SufD
MQTLIDLKQNKIFLREDGEIIGFFVLDNDTNIKTTIKFIHDRPNVKSRIRLKFILLDQSKLTLNAIATIEQGAKQVDTYLKIDALLLSEDAEANIEPSMEIKENDVKGGHGATIGMLNEQQLWYLMSRGLTKKQAEKILIQGWVQDLLQDNVDASMQKVFQAEFKKI